MYTIIGGDGREYGPVSAEQVRQWMASGRANAQTRVKPADTLEWKTLAEFPEFAVTRPGIAAPAPVGPPAFDPLECFNRSWQLLRANFWSFIGICLLPILLSSGFTFALSHSSWAPVPDRDHPFAMFFSGYFEFRLLITFLVFQPLSEGSFYYILKRARGESAGFSDLFAGFTRAYGSLIVAALLGALFSVLGLFCLVIPGVYLVVAYSFSRLAVIDRRCSAWTGLELSRRAVHTHWWSVLLLFILGAVICMVGIVALLVGVFVALPLFYGAIVYAYLDLTPPVIATPTEVA